MGSVGDNSFSLFVLGNYKIHKVDTSYSVTFGTRMMRIYFLLEKLTVINKKLRISSSTPGF